MKKTLLSLATTVMLLTTNSFAEVSTQRLTEFIHWYPAIEQAKMRDEWLKEHKPGEWQFTGQATADDRTVVTVQADVNYGYSWFNISNEPVVITMPKYDKYYSLSVFDMNHFMEVTVMPEKPVVIRLPHQKSPVKDAHEIVLQTYQGLAFTRQVIVNNETEVMELAKKITIEGGGGNFPFIVPAFNEEEIKAGTATIAKYVKENVKDGTKLFGSVYEGVGDLDRSAGVLIGQLGTQDRYAKYNLYQTDGDGAALNKDGSYEMTIPADGLFRNDKGYWSLTVYGADKYLIPNEKNIYNVSMYRAKKNSDGSYTIRVNPKGEGDNAVPTTGKDWYCVLRFYEPAADMKYPKMNKVSK